MCKIIFKIITEPSPNTASNVEKLKNFSGSRITEFRALLRATLEERLQLIRQNSNVLEVFEAFPFLSKPDGLIEEFKIRTSKPNTKWLSMKLLRLSKKHPELSTDQLLLKLPEILGDSGQLMFDDSVDEIPVYPVILKNESHYWVRLENAAFCKTSSLKECMMCWAFTYQIFELSYPEGLEATINFFIK